MTDTGVKIEVKWIDRDGLQKAMRKALVVSTSRVMRAVSLRMKDMQRHHFETAVDSSGKPWKPLSPNTIAARQHGKKTGAQTRALYKAMGIDVSGMSFFGGAQTIRLMILRDTGRLMNSISADNTIDTAVAGTNVVYAATHQFGREGGGFKGSDIPQREFIYINQEEGQILTDLIARELIGKTLTGER